MILVKNPGKPSSVEVKVAASDPEPAVPAPGPPEGCCDTAGGAFERRSGVPNQRVSNLGDNNVTQGGQPFGMMRRNVVGSPEWYRFSWLSRSVIGPPWKPWE
jgi:hypothetical protein